MEEWKWRTLILCVFWWMAAIPDLKSRTIPVRIPAFFLAAVVLANLCLPTSIDRKLLWEGAVPGGALLLLSYVLKGKIGEGDGICLLVGGLIVGVARILFVLEGALALVSLAGIILIAARKGKAEDRIAFLPFLALSASFLFFIETSC